MTRDTLVLNLLLVSRRHINQVRRFATRCGIKDPDFVNEVMQETAFRIHESVADTFSPVLGTSEAYIRRVMYFVCVANLRNYREASSLSAKFDVDTDEFDPVSIAVRREEDADSHAAYLSLSAADRQAVIQWWNTIKSRPDQAAETGTSTKDVRNFRIRQRFLKELIQIRSKRLTASKK